MADTKPTASSSDDLVEKLQARIDQYIPMMGYTGFYTAYDVALDRKILKCLRQPVAGDVVEREKIARIINPAAFEFGDTVGVNCAFITTDAILKLIGGGK